MPEMFALSEHASAQGCRFGRRPPRTGAMATNDARRAPELRTH